MESHITVSWVTIHRSDNYNCDFRLCVGLFYIEQMSSRQFECLQPLISSLVALRLIRRNNPFTLYFTLPKAKSGSLIHLFQQQSVTKPRPVVPQNRVCVQSKIDIIKNLGPQNHKLNRLFHLKVIIYYWSHLAPFSQSHHRYIIALTNHKWLPFSWLISFFRLVLSN